MILCWIILIVGAVMATFGGIGAYIIRYRWADVWDWVVGFSLILGVCALLVSSLLLIILPIEANQKLHTFVSQKEYIENYEPTSEYDSAAILNKKIELNEWLYEKQYVKKHRPICSFYGDEILELEPIK